LRYIDNVVATDRKMIGKVFHVLKWTSRELDRTITELQKQRIVTELKIEGRQGAKLVSVCALEWLM
jgi:hypothetical protein